MSSRPVPPSIRRALTTQRNLRIALGAFGMVVVVGTLGYRLIEGWSLLDALWMVVITVTTIGFGEVQPLSEAGRIFSLVLILFGVGIVTYTATTFARAMIDGDMARLLRQRRKERSMRKLENHYIVVGYGRLGRVVVEDLIQNGVPVCVVERDGSVVEELERSGKVPVVQGDGSCDDNLHLAGVERAQGLAIALPSAAEAVYVSMAASQLNPELNIVTRIDEPEASFRARRVGARQVVNPYRLAGWRMAHGLMRPLASNFLDLATFSVHHEFAVDEQHIPDGSPFAGRSLKELKIGAEHKLLVVAIQKPNGSLQATPGGDVVLETGDTVIVLGDPKRLVEFGRAVSGGQGSLGAAGR
jgi:voltage-gated potassium channel